MINFISRCWCRMFHKKVFRPVRGKYICAACFCEWPVTWDAKESRSLDGAAPLFERRIGDRRRRESAVHAA